MADRFVSTGGLTTNPGTIEAPWPLAAVLADKVNAYAKPGDTVYVRGGVYRHPDRTPTSRAFQLFAKGAPGQPVTFRAYKRERATIDGGINAATFPLPAHVRLWGLEVIVQELLDNPTRKSNIPGGGQIPTDLNCPWGGIDITGGESIDIINCVIHGNIQGIGLWKRLAGATVYGCMIYDNGYTAADRNHGHAIYTQNGTEPRRRIANNIVFDAWQSNLQAYGSSDAPVQNYDIEENIFLAGRADDRVLIGGNAAGYPRNSVVRGNWAFDCQLILGYNTNGGPGCVLEHNLVPARLDLSSGLVAPIIQRNFSPGFITDGGPLKQIPGNFPVPTTAVVRVTPNEFDVDRLHIGFHNPAGDPTIVVSAGLLSALSIGDSYAIYKPNDLWGPPLNADTWNGDLIALPSGGRRSGAFVLMVDRDPCAAVVRERDQLRSELLVALAQRNDLQAALLVERQGHAATSAQLDATRKELEASIEREGALDVAMQQIIEISNHWRT